MVSCPNCGEKVRNGFEYCRYCGCPLNAENPGDYRTDLLNVFHHKDGYVYLFSEKGNQVVLSSDSLDGLSQLACERQYPWEFSDWKSNFKASRRETFPSPLIKSEFLKASALKEPEIIPTSSLKKQKVQKEEGYTPDYEVSRVVE